MDEYINDLVKIEFDGEKPTGIKIEIQSKKQAIEVLKALHDAELMECEHVFTEKIDVEDERWIGLDGRLHTRTFADADHCLVCDKYYEPGLEEWV